MAHGATARRGFFYKLFTLTLAFLTVLNLLSAWQYRPSHTICESRQIAWSPFSAVGNQHVWKHFPKSTLFTESEFVALSVPIEQLEKMWNDFLPKHPISIPRSRLSTLQISSEYPAHVPRDPTSVLAIPEVFVQLECLSLLRQHLAYRANPNYTHHYDNLPAFKGNNSVVMRRADLCVERLRNTITCRSDLSTILQDLVPPKKQGDHPASGLHFDAYHKCRDLEAIRGWTEEHAVRAVRLDNAWWGGRVFE
ncbi:hypothetical protein QBC35DRAFT_547472 [Podospora australis]|uniref:Uncharacterized protein n=1 Tax=Podospora australis TaxID=1536484 RepID=A0AAN6WLS7_9PEZI|nr:hypothetical protein QBC35DRAFT_547472 [Podospora australis]